MLTAKLSPNAISLRCILWEKFSKSQREPVFQICHRVVPKLEQLPASPGGLIKTWIVGASLVAQWLRICLLMQGTRV